jgi:hypothetical protein
MNKHDCNIVRNTTEYSAKEPYHYSVKIAGVGGEAVVGRLTHKVAEYWNSQDREMLAVYHMVQGGCLNLDLNDNEIDPGFSTERWHECDELMHENGPILEAQPRLFVESGHRDVYRGTIGRGLLKAAAQEPEFVEIDDTSSYLFGHTADAVCHSYCIDIADKFDPRKVRVRSKSWGGVCVVSGMTYDGVEVPLTDFDSQPANDLECVLGVVMNS